MPILLEVFFVKDTYIQIRVNSNLKSKLKEICDKRGVSISEYILDLIKLDIYSHSQQ
jgi:antitoxin component of RelBE/YafQ-DinJ toxin-antitoxin module